MTIQCDICGKEVKGQAQLRIHRAMHEHNSQKSISPPPQAQQQSFSYPLPMVQQTSSLDILKKQIADQNEMLMLLKMNKELTKAMNETPQALQQPSSVNDFISQYNAIHNLRKDIKNEVLEELDDEEQYSDDEMSPEDTIMHNLAAPLLQRLSNGNPQTQLSNSEATTTEAKVDKALQQ